MQHCCCIAFFYVKMFLLSLSFRCLSIALWKAHRVDLIDVLCKLLTPPKTGILDSETSTQPVELGIPPLTYCSDSTITASGPYQACTPTRYYGTYLKRCYKTFVPQFVSQWPPPPSHKIFSLALIKKEKIQRSRIDNEFVRLTITGRVDDILRKKVPVKLEELLKPNKEKRKVILVEGAPGSGKTTLSWHICQKWSEGLLFQNYEAVILVQLRDPAVQGAKEIAELLPAPDRLIANDVAAQIAARHGKNVLLILDGWDEMSVDLQKRSLVRRLIEPQFLQDSPLLECSLIVTSRSVASGDLHPLVSSRIEIVGFTPSVLRQYFSECLEGDSEAIERLFERIRENPVVESCCYLPLNAAIICHLFITDNLTLPSTQFGVFSAVVLNCILRYLMERSQCNKDIECLESLLNLPDFLKIPFESLCKLAYVGVMQDKITFSSSDVRVLGFESPETLGLLQIVKCVSAFGKSSSYNFLSLSIQELLAAIHISQLPSPVQIETFQRLFGQPRFSCVFQFYAAI